MPESTNHTCPACDGRGRVPTVVLSDQEERVQFFQKSVPVMGYIVERSCRFCEGTGRLPDAEALEVDGDVPPAET